MEKLIQKRLIDKRVVILHNDKVELRIRSHRIEKTLFFGYESIKNNKFYWTEKSQPNYSMHVITRNLSIVFLLCYFFGVVENLSLFFISIISSLIFFIFHCYTVKSFVEIETSTKNEDELAFFRLDPTKKEVNEFIEKIYSYRNNYLKENYYKDIDVTNESNIDNLNILLKDNIISKKEYDIKVQEKFMAALE